MSALELPQQSPAATATPSGGLRGRLPPWLRSRRALVLAAVTLVGAGLALGWPWVVAAGIAPLALAVLPCAAMCVVGLCMVGKDDGRSCASPSPRDGATPTPRG